MITANEILKSIKEVSIKSNILANHIFFGGYKSAFKGQGMKFKEVREYQAGDDVRFIDWNVSARMQKTYTKVFEEERELAVYILLDISSSTLFGTTQMKREMMFQICANLCYSAIKNGDKVGLVLFGSKVEKHILPQKKSEHTQYIAKVLEAIQFSQGNTNISTALNYVNKNSIHKNIVFILSDFVNSDYEKALGNLAQKHDVIGLQITDKMDGELPNIGLMQTIDFETGERKLVDTSNKKGREKYKENFLQQQITTKDIFNKAGAALLPLETGKDYINSLHNFFMQRTK